MLDYAIIGKNYKDYGSHGIFIAFLRVVSGISLDITDLCVFTQPSISSQRILDRSRITRLLSLPKSNIWTQFWPRLLPI